MKNIIAILTILTLFSSCQAYKKKICLQCPTRTEIKDTTIYKETVKYDTSYFSIPGPTITVESPCDSLGRLKSFKVVEKKNGLISTVQNIGGNIVADCNADSLMKVNKELTKEINQFRSEIREVPHCDLEHVSKMDSFFIILGRIFLVFLFLLLIRLVLKYYFKLPIP